MFGDGIQHVTATRSGSCWVGYFDEGIFGNFGWGGPGPAPIGRFGINRFDQTMHLAAHAPSEYEIADCYAMTAVDESVFACTYTDWEIVRLGPSGERRSWTNDVAGASAIVVKGSAVALVGGYTESRSRLVVGSLGESRFEPTMTTTLTIDGEDITGDKLLVASGHQLHAMANGGWYRWELA